MGVFLPPAEELRHGIQNIDEPQLLFIGRLVEIKGLKYLLEALVGVKKEFPGILLSIVGDGPEWASLHNLTMRLNIEANVVFYGHLSGHDKEKQLENADVMIIPSIRDSKGHEEGLPVTLLEGIAHGKMIITTRTGSMASVIVPSNGILVGDKDSKQLCDAIISALNLSNVEINMLQISARDTANKFSWNVIGDRACELFERSINA